MELAEVVKKFAYVEFLDEDDQLKVIERQPCAIHLINNPSFKLQRAALLNGGVSIMQIMHNPDIRTWQIAIEIDYMSIGLHPAPPSSLQIFAIKRNRVAYNAINNPTQEATDLYLSICDAFAYFNIPSEFGNTGKDES